MNAFIILAPAGLLALAALGLPLLVHLISRSRGRRVLVGNIDLYRQAKRQRVTELRLVQWLLLILRLALLALAALLLAGLSRPGLETLKGRAAYLTPDWLDRADASQQEALDGFEHIFVLAPGYPPASESPGAGNPADLWSLLAERLSTVRHAGDVHVFAAGDAGQFPATAPALPTPVAWHFAPPAGPAPTPRLAVDIVFEPERAADAALVEAALAAAARFRDVTVEMSRRPASEPAAGRPVSEAAAGDRTAAVIWLGAGPVDADLVAGLGAGLADADVLLTDRSVAGAETRRAELPAWPTARFLAAPADPGPADGRTLWRDHSGAPLLVERLRGPIRHLDYLDRLDAEPDGLAGQAAFPDALLQLLLGERAWDNAVNHAPVDPTAVVQRPAPAGGLPHRPLAPWLALAMAVLFGLERWLSERPARTESPPRG